jgi:8-oxo-dGTP diphosphatase
MTSFSDDPVAWRQYLAEGNARQARKRVSADVLFRDTASRILLVDPVYKPDWDLPGGMAEANESPRVAAAREVREELGFTPQLGDLLLLEWMPPHGPWDDLLAFIFDGGVLTEVQIAQLHITDEELRAFEFCTKEQAMERLRPYVLERLDHALEALRTGRPWYREAGSGQGSGG